MILDRRATPDEYDLMTYAKNGHRPQLLENLTELYARHIEIHYGQYKREQLFEAARRSRRVPIWLTTTTDRWRCRRFCLQVAQPSECEPGRLLYEMESLGFGSRDCRGRTSDFLPAGCSSPYGLRPRIAQAMEISRHQVREYAVQEYSTDRITSAIVAKLDELRAIRIPNASHYHHLR